MFDGGGGCGLGESGGESVDDHESSGYVSCRLSGSSGNSSQDSGERRKVRERERERRKFPKLDKRGSL